MKVVVISTSATGRALGESLPFEHVRGSLASSFALAWNEADVVVCVGDVSSVVRAAAPLLGRDPGPGIVCVDESATWVVAVLEGRGSASAVAIEVADRLDADVVLTESVGGGRLDEFDAFSVEGEVEVLAAALAEGAAVDIEVDPELREWPLPPRLVMAATAVTSATGPRPVVVVTDRITSPRSGDTVLHPRSLVAGIAASAGASAREIDDLLHELLRDEGLSPEALAEVATSDLCASELGVLALGLPVRSFSTERLLGVKALPRVAEAAARRSAGRDGTLVTSVRSSSDGSVVIARRARPRGQLALVGLGPGDPEQRTGAAADAVLLADVVVASGTDLEQVRDLLRPRHEVVERMPGDEPARVRQALAEAERGRRVVLLCSGDAGVYALAPMACELAADADADVDVIPGVTAATSAAALLGAPLGHDFVLISLSDAFTPWEVIASRIRAAGEADLVAVFYEPRTSGRPDQLARARRILLEHRKPETPVGIVTDAYRPEEELTVTTLGDLDPTLVGMTTTVIVGSTTTTVVDGRMVTPAAYLP